MSHSPPDVVRERIREGLDTEWMGLVRRAADYAVGGSKHVQDAGSTYGDNEWPYYPDRLVKNQEVGRANLILNASRLRKSRLLSTDVAPVTKGVHRRVSEARKQAWLHWVRTYEFRSDIALQFDSYDLLGLGAMYTGIARDYESRKQRIDLRYCPPTDCVFDPHKRDPNQGRWAAFRWHVPMEEALAMYRNDPAKQALIVQSVQHFMEGGNYPKKLVPFVYYFDRGCGAYGPTEAIYVGSLCDDNNGVHCADNRLGAFVPGSFGIKYLPPFQRKPVGSVFLERPYQEQYDRIVKRVQKTMAKGPVDLWNVASAIHDEVRKYANDQNNGTILLKEFPTKAMIKEALLRVPGAELQQAVIVLLEITLRQFNEAAGLSETERGNFDDNGATKFEVSQVTNNAVLNRAYDDRQTVLMVTRTIEKAFYVAQRFHRAPFPIDVFGTDITVNDEDDPRSSCFELFSEPGYVYIDTASLTATDDRRKKEGDMADLLALKQFNVNQDRAAEEAVKIMGFEDFEQWRAAPQLGPEAMQAISQLAPGSVAPNSLPVQPAAAF